MTRLGWAATAVAVLVAGNLAAARLAERRHPPRGRFAVVDGVRVHYVERGPRDAPPVVLLHGNGGMWQDWQSAGLLDDLATDHHVIAFDRPGFGHSGRPCDVDWTPERQAALLAGALRQIGLDRPAVVVGHSWGCLVALALARDHAGMTASLVLVAGFYYAPDGVAVPVLAHPLWRRLGDALRLTALPPLAWMLRRRLLGVLFQPARVTTGFQARFPLALAMRPSQLAAWTADTLLMVPGARALLAWPDAYRLPVTLLAGTGDALCPIDKQSRRLHRLLPDSTLIEVEGGGHMVHHTASARVAAAIRQTAA